MFDIEKLDEAGLFSRNAPRYTSYPTAPQFHEGVAGTSYDMWVKALPEGAKLSIYVHIPFCERLCWYCACRTQGVKTLSPVAAYLKVLKAEIARLAATVPAGVSIGRMHWGGGTPTILPPEQIESLMAELRKIAPIDDDWEFSVEMDPTAIDDAKLDALAAAGMNRASIGIQDFNPDVQAAIGRIQSFEVTNGVISGLRDRGINSINTDIVYGLPHQTLDSFDKTIGQVLTLDPDRIALFGYAHVPWMAKRQKMIAEDSLPNPRSRFDLFNHASSVFTDAGYQALGIDHFAKPTDSLAKAAAGKRMRRNFQGYTDDACTALIGLGASSISRFPQGYIQNRVTTNAYTADITSDRWSAVRGIALSPEDMLRARAIETLMCDFEIDMTALTAAYGNLADIILPDLQRINETYADFVDFDGKRLRIKDEGFHLTRLIACELDAYLTSAAKHSMAV